MKTYDPNKPAYQTNFLLPDFIAQTHPGLTVVQVETTAEIIRHNEIQRGADAMWYGMWIAVVCAVAHGAIKSSYPLLKPFSKILEWGIVGGVGTIIIGMLYKQTVEYEKIIALALGLAVGGFLLYRYRDWSISHLLGKIKEKVGAKTDG